MTYLELRMSDALRPGMVIDHWAGNDEIEGGKAVEKTLRHGPKVIIEYFDGTRETVPHYAAAFIREPTVEAQKGLIFDLLRSERAVKWRKQFGLLAIDKAHIPLGWVSPEWISALKELVEERRLAVRDFGQTGVYLVDDPFAEPFTEDPLSTPWD